MKKLENVTNKAVVAITRTRQTVNELFGKKVRGGSHFVEILIGIVVVVAVGYIFRDQIIAFMNTIMGRSTTEALGLF